MILNSSLYPLNLASFCSSYHKTSHSIISPLNHITKQSDSEGSEKPHNGKPNPLRFCPCGRRHFLEAAATGLLSLPSANASDYKAVLNRVRPPRPDWYEELYASVLNSDAMKSYEAEIAAYKSQLFTNLRGKAKKVLEIGIGTGPNLKYYASGDDLEVIGMDPNGKMEKYAREEMEAAGVLPANFKFIQALGNMTCIAARSNQLPSLFAIREVGESIPLSDASVDAIIGTLVLCSVTDVDQTLQEVKRVLRPGGLYLFVEHVAAKDGTFLRFVQNVLDPLQQTLSDGCHLTRETGKKIFEAGFSGVDLSTAFLSKATFANPQVYGIASK